MGKMTLALLVVAVSACQTGAFEPIEIDLSKRTPAATTPAPTPTPLPASEVATTVPAPAPSPSQNPASFGETAPQDHSAAFKRIQALAGDWEGSLEWSGTRTATGKMNATYYATGGGTAVVENLVVDRDPVMTSVYHLDGGTLRVTHYCAAGNQPRLKAENVDDRAGTVRFALVDITNLSEPKAPHVEKIDLEFVDENHIVLTFGFVANGAVSRERIDLHRTGRPARGNG
jgi:hypothetical protein